MASASLVPPDPAAAPRRPLRLKLKPKARTTGYVDGAWWPRSRDLAAEVPALAEVLAFRLGAVRRVTYSPAAWNASPRQADVAGQSIRLEGFRSQDDNILHVTGADRRRISLLVIPPEATDEAGHNAIMTAGSRGNAETPAEILAAAGIRAANPRLEFGLGTEDAENRWEIDGGHVCGRG